MATLDDRAAVASWYEDKVRHSFHKKPLIVSSDQHRRWFENWSGEAQDKLLAIALLDIIRVAAIRFDRKDTHEFHATILIRAPYLGKNLSSKLLVHGLAFIRGHYPEAILTAQLPYANKSSRDLFIEAGMLVSEPNNGTITVRFGAAT